jgi:hypothetical protein
MKITKAIRNDHPYPPDWAVDTETVINGRRVQPGQELSIQGEPGRFRFQRAVLNVSTGAEWIDVFPCDKKMAQYRSFRPERVKRVHLMRNG